MMQTLALKVTPNRLSGISAPSFWCLMDTSCVFMSALHIFTNVYQLPIIQRSRVGSTVQLLYIPNPY